MHPTYKSFKMFMKQLLSDGMLIMMVIAPVLAGFFFKFGIPFIEQLLTNHFKSNEILSPYYELFDLFLINLTSYMFLFAASMNMLDEHDQNITSYLIVTPIKKKGYLISRLIYITLLSTIYSIIITLLFRLSTWMFYEIIIFAILTSLLSLIFSLSLFAFSKNKVEGMALAKLSGLLLMGLPIPYFIFDLKQYIFGFLPSFWVAHLKLEMSLLNGLGLFVTLFIWFFILYKKFIKKLSF